MRRFFCGILAALFIITACDHSDQKPIHEQKEPPKMPDEDAIHQAVLDAYKVIGFKKGGKPDYDAFKKYFIPDARFINYRTDTLEILSMDQFLGLYKKAVDSGFITSFYEEEIFGRTDQYGRVAQRISSFRTYMNNTDSVTNRGVNSFQLIKKPEGWRVTSIIWDVEKQSLPIPQHYLETGSEK